MMRTSLLLFLSLLLVQSATAQKSITLEDIWVNGAFSARGVPGFAFRNDGVHYTRSTGTTIEQYDLRSGEKTSQVFDVATVQKTDPAWPGAFDDYTFSADEQNILLSANVESIYRHSTKAHYFVFDARQNSILRLHNGADKQRYAHFSPQGDKVAYECNNNLFFKDLKTGKQTQMTTDGKPNAVINGASDWVYEEEFVLVRAFEWSPDGQKIAYLRFDEQAVPSFTYEHYHPDSMYPQPVTFKYPKVGEKNAVVTAWVYDLKTGKTVGINAGADAEDYFPRLAWTPDGRVCLTWLNRHQNHLKLLLADPKTGACSVLLEEKNQYYIGENYEPHFLDDGSGFLWETEKDGFLHVYRYDMSGREQALLTRGDWDVTAFYGIDQKNKKAYYQAATINPMQREVFETDLSGRNTRMLHGGSGTHSADFSSTFDYYVHSESGINTPPAYVVRNRAGEVVRPLEDNGRLKTKISEYGLSKAEFFQFETPEKVRLNGWMIRPKGAETAGQRYPVLLFTYGGPGSQEVLDEWMGANYLWFQMLAQQGYLVACVDNRGTGGRGEAFKKMTYLQLGHYETIDQIEAARYLGSLPYVDPTRIGIFGWSYGGYLSSLCILKGADVFKAAIAVAPVTNWKWYDTVYTERFMRTHSENKEGYEQNSPINFAEQLKGAYLLVHGQADDNVHFQNTVEMTNRLVAANKDFDVMFYPNRNHGIYGGYARLHLYRKMTAFLDASLKLVKQ
ncbi:MAG: S9 family peptidase [Saprospiraceae bacterium]|nr:S9 family peptidase [Saprospiraceae bacterium]